MLSFSSRDSLRRDDTGCPPVLTNDSNLGMLRVGHISVACFILQEIFCNFHLQNNPVFFMTVILLSYVYPFQGYLFSFGIHGKSFSCVCEEMCSFNIVNLLDLQYAIRSINSREAHTGCTSSTGK